ILSHLFIMCCILSGFLFLFYGLVLFGSLSKLWGIVNTLTLEHFQYIFTVGFESIKDTLILALTATPFIGILGMLISYLLIRKNFVGKKMMEIFTIILFAVPGTVIGI